MREDEVKRTIQIAEATNKSALAGHAPVVVRLADVEREEVDWMWADRIPRGKLTMIEGDPGVGKSWLTMALACAVTQGNRFPGDDEQVKYEPSGVLLLTAEDGLADTIRPRLEDMGADLARINILTGVRGVEGKEQHLSLEEDIEAIEQTISAGDYKLLIIDPLNAYLGSSIDTHRDAALRFVLTPLAKLAERHGVAVICVRHLTKSPRDKAIYRGQGSIAYNAAARVVHLVGINPENDQERAIVCIKNNLAVVPPALAFEITNEGFFWKGETDITAESLLSPDAGQEEQGVLSEAKEFLTETLTDGPLSAFEAFRKAKAIGISERTLKRAKRALGVKTVKEGYAKTGRWVWSLPKALRTTKEANTSSQEKLALLDDSEHEHEYATVTTAAGTFTRCKHCGEFPPKSDANK